MVDQLSPLGHAYKPGSHGNFVDGVGVRIAEDQPGSITQVACWPGQRGALIEAVGSVTGLRVADVPGASAMSEHGRAFWIAPGRMLVTGDDEAWPDSLSQAIGASVGTVTDLSHGRTVLVVEGQRAEWILSKFFAVDFASLAFPVGHAVSTVHHDIFAQILRTSDQRFELFIFRSYARSFWTALCHASEEVGYEVR